MDEHFGNGVVIRSDGVGYYAWLRSLLIDGDWRFENEFEELNVTRSTIPFGITATGYRANQWSVGPACVWAAVVVPCHGLVSAGAFGNLAADGYTLPYQLAVAVTGLAAGLLTLVLTFRICCRFADPVAAACAAACVTLGSPLVFYAAVEPSMAHGLGSAALALFVWYWLRDFGSASPRRWVVLGVLLGLVALMRWQLATFGIVLLGELVRTVWVERRVAGACRAGVALAVGLAVGVFPQLVAWRIVYGAWLVEPMPLGRNWLTPDVWRILGSFERSYFYWTPITFVSTVGLLVAVAGRAAPIRRMQAGLLLMAVASQVYALAVVSGSGVYLGSAYGYRFLTESTVVLAPGLAALLAVRGRWAVGVTLLGCTLVGWNLLLMGAYRYSMLATGGAPAELVSAAWTYVRSVGQWGNPEGAAMAVATTAFLASLLTYRWGRPVPADARSVVTGKIDSSRGVPPWDRGPLARCSADAIAMDTTLERLRG